MYSCMEVEVGGCLSSRVAWLPLLSVLWWEFGQGLMGCWWFIRKTPMHGFDCVWVRSILAAVSFTVRGVMVSDLLVSGASSVGHAGLAFIPRGLGGPRAAALAAQWLCTAWLLGGEPPRGALAAWQVCCSSQWMDLDFAGLVFSLPDLVVRTEPRVAGLRLDRHQFWWQQN